MTEPTELVCDCGASPSSDESEGTGTYEEDGKTKYICLACWCVENYGENSVEARNVKHGIEVAVPVDAKPRVLN